MGNHKLRLSNIIPNAWFHKLKEMGMITTTKSARNRNRRQLLPTTTTTYDAHHILDTSNPHNSPSLRRKSYHFSRKKTLSSKKTTNSTPTPSSTTTTTTTKSSSSSSVSAACSCRSTATATVQPAIRSSKPEEYYSSSFTTTSPDHVLQSFDRMVAWSSTSPVPDYDEDDHDDVVIGVDKMSLRCKTGENVVSRVGIPPIRTDHKKFSELVKEIGEADEQVLLVDKPNKQRKSSVKYKEDHATRSPVRRVSTGSGSPRVRVRISSPKLSRRAENGGGRKSTSRSNRRKKSISTESMAVVKSSSDPERDFKESMMEMIVENEMRESKELEELLACYLSLNSVEYHHLIVHVFQQIWFDLHHIY